MDSKIKVLILAGGKGKRMGHDTAKVLAPLSGRPMIKHLLKKIGLSFGTPHIVVGHSKEDVMKELGDKYHYVVQEEQLGTGHALFSAKENLKDVEHIILLQGDQPFTTANSIQKLIERHLKSGAKITFATTVVPDFLDWRKVFLQFGRIVKNGSVSEIIEYKDATEEQKNIKELNAGCYVFDAKWAWENFEKIKNDNAQNEYYLTDFIKIAKDQGEKVETVQISPEEALGASTKEDLGFLEKFVVE